MGSEQENQEEKQIQVEFVDSRYKLDEAIGEGGMGVVYKASDRLTGEDVALKQVNVIKGLVDSSDDKVLRLQLAREFQLLAGLRHPNVIGVYDYGFNDSEQPYFTMDLLERPQTLLEAAETKDTKGRVKLLLDVLQALAYLHRRGILHRDLKPNNILVDKDGTTKVLDFGLAAPRSEAGEVMGTLAYIAPEVLQEYPVSEASDLYAFGVIAFEMFAGRHPFDLTEYRTLVTQILLETPTFAEIQDNEPALVPIIQRLLVKDPNDRYQNAQEVIEALCAAVNIPVPTESIAIRESYLQAAEFVGRDEEMKSLLHAFEEARNGKGSVWLIGGESGIGKSRLAHELRIRTVVRGTLVLQGQATEGGGLPYQLWRSILRQLAIVTDLSDQEAGVFKEVIPDIERFVDRSVPNPPLLSGEDNRQRFAVTLASVIRRLNRPVVLILEDLQWATDSLAPLKQLNAVVNDLPLLIVGTYRSDESTDFIKTLPGVNDIQLQRLDDAAVAKLSQSMLGETGANPRVVKMLKQETEGNTFFIVEIMRALAEDIGGLDKIGHKTLPKEVVAGGIQQVIRRRLERVPNHYRGLLRLAAVAGREIDHDVLTYLAEKYSINLDDWLTQCVNAAVLEIEDDRWFFTHDKLRLQILSDLPKLELPAFHQQVAEAIEWVHLGDINYSLQLSRHWYATGRPGAEKARYFAATAAGQMQAMGNFVEARQMYELVFELTDDEDRRQQATLLRALTDICVQLSDYDAAEQYAAKATAAAKDSGRSELEMEALLSEASLDEHKGDYPNAKDLMEQAYNLLGEKTRARLRVQVLTAYAKAMARAGEFEKAHSVLDEAFVIEKEKQERAVSGQCYEAKGMVLFLEDNLGGAELEWYDALMHFEALGSYDQAALVRGNLGKIALKQERYSVAAAHLELSLRVYRQMDYKWGIVDRLIGLGKTYHGLEDPKVAKEYFEEAVELAQEIKVQNLISQAVLAAAQVNLAEKSFDKASQLVGFAMKDTQTFSPVQMEATEILEKLKGLMTEEELNAALDIGATLHVKRISDLF